MTLFRRLVLLVAAMLCLASPALAAEAKTYAVAPFTVHGPEKYQYLSQGAQSMLESRMNWPGHLAPLDKAKASAALAKAPGSEADAKKALAAVGADYLAYGSITVSGDQASVDITVVGRDGKKWPKNFTTKLSDLIPSMERAAQTLNNEIFKRPAASGADGGQTINQMNPDFVVNQTNENQKAYLNPNFRYAGPAETPGVWRSQSMPIVSSGIAIDDLNGDGKNEVVIMAKDSIETYAFKDRQLMPIARYAVSPNLKLLKVSTLDINGDGKAEIIVSASYFKEPRSFILSLEGNQLKELYKDIKLYMNVAQVPPDYSRQLVGSKGDAKELFAQGVHNVIFSGGQPMLSTKLTLPDRKSTRLNSSH